VEPVSKPANNVFKFDSWGVCQVVGFRAFSFFRNSFVNHNRQYAVVSLANQHGRYNAKPRGKEIIMKLKDAISKCHVRSAVYRKKNPKVRYWKNHSVPIVKRVPFLDRFARDWEEYDPRDDDNGSLFMFND
jgi:hypothetical protein